MFEAVRLLGDESRKMVEKWQNAPALAIGGEEKRTSPVKFARSPCTDPPGFTLASRSVDTGENVSSKVRKVTVTKKIVTT